MSGEMVVADPSGVWRAKSIQRNPESERWVEVPWAARDGDPKANGEKVEVSRLRPEEIEVEQQRAEVRPVVRFSIKREDLERHGFADRCPGCKANLRNTVRQGHSEECRNRLAKEMRGERKVEESRKREDDFLAKRFEQSDSKRIRAGQR